MSVTLEAEYYTSYQQGAGDKSLQLGRPNKGGLLGEKNTKKR